MVFSKLKLLRYAAPVLPVLPYLVIITGGGITIYLLYRVVKNSFLGGLLGLNKPREISESEYIKMQAENREVIEKVIDVVNPVTTAASLKDLGFEAFQDAVNLVQGREKKKAKDISKSDAEMRQEIIKKINSSRTRRSGGRIR